MIQLPLFQLLVDRDGVIIDVLPGLQCEARVCIKHVWYAADAPMQRVFFASQTEDRVYWPETYRAPKL